MVVHLLVAYTKDHTVACMVMTNDVMMIELLLLHHQWVGLNQQSVHVFPGIQSHHLKSVV